MKVLLINDFLKGGGAEEVYRSTGELLKDRVEISYFYKYESYRLAETPLDYIYSFKNKKVLYATLQKEKPDIVHIHNYYHVLSPSILSAIRDYKQKSTVKVILTTHDFHIVCPSSGMTWFEGSGLNYVTHRISQRLSLWNKLTMSFDNRGFLYSTIKKVQWLFAYEVLKLYKVIDLIISPGYFLKGMLEQQNPGLPPVKVVRNPVKLKFTRDSVKECLGRKKEPAFPLQMIFTGRLSPEKGLIQLISTLGRIDKAKYRLSIYGSGETYFIEALNAVIAKYGLEDVIHLKGYVDMARLGSIMESMDVMVLTSILYENAPLSIVEATVKGLATFTLNHGGMKEMAELSGRHYFFELNDPASLEDAMNRCIADPVQGTADPNFTELEKMKNYDQEIMKVYRDLMRSEPGV